MENVSEYWVYIIESEKDGRWYIGQTNDLARRVRDHNRGYSNYTKKFRPWHLYASKIFTDRAEAMRVERRIKNFKSRSLIEEYIKSHDFVID